MIKKTLLYGALAFNVLTPLTVVAATQSVSAKEAVIDSAITAQVKALYLKSPLVKSADISVMTVNQVVVLTGTVATDIQYERAITLAESVNNVNEVNVEHLDVKKSIAPISDTLITAKVKGVFLKEKLFGKKSIEYWPVVVETKDSVVYLTGKVSTATERKNLINLAQKVNGVKSVNSSITLK